jgi:hypothetical protein
VEVKRRRPASPILSFDAFDAPRTGRPAMRDQSRAIGRRLYDGVIATEKAEEVDAFAEGYIQNTGWTPDGRSYCNAWAIGRGAMPTASRCSL